MRRGINEDSIICHPSSCGKSESMQEQLTGGYETLKTIEGSPLLNIRSGAYEVEEHS